MTDIFTGADVNSDGIFDPTALPEEVELALAKLQSMGAPGELNDDMADEGDEYRQSVDDGEFDETD